MPYLVDGHNLIPKIGLKLDSFDDENELIKLMNEYCRLSRHKQVEIYFDNAQPIQREKKKMGLVTVYFVRRPVLADDAIRNRLAQLNKDAKNWNVVTSDRRVQVEARNAGAKVISSEEFSRTVMDLIQTGIPSDPSKPTNSNDVEEWMELFSGKRKS